jgi:hypothetical protein
MISWKLPTIIKKPLRIEALSRRFDGFTSEQHIRLSGTAFILRRIPARIIAEKLSIVVSQWLAGKLAEGHDEIERRRELAIRQPKDLRGKFIKVRRRPQLRIVRPEPDNL